MEAKLFPYSKYLKSSLDDLSFTLDKFLKMRPKSPFVDQLHSPVHPA